MPPDLELPPNPLPQRWLWLCWSGTFFVYVALLPQFLLYSSPPTGDQPYYLLNTISLVQDLDLDVANNYAARDEDKFYSLAPHPPGFIGMSAPYPLPLFIARSGARPPAEQYDYHSVGLSFLLAPAWIVGSWFSLWWPATIAFMCAIGALVSANIFLLAYETSRRTRIGAAVWLPLALTSPLVTYAFLIFTELPTSLVVIYAFRRFTLGWKSNSRLRLGIIGLGIGFIPWLSWRCMVIALPLLVLAAISWWRGRNSGTDLGGEKRSFFWVAAPAAALWLTLLGFYVFVFGNPFPAMKVPELGDADPFHFPWKGSDALVATVTNTFALLFDRQMGLLPYAPVYLLAAVGIIGMWHSARPADRRLLGALALVSLPYIGLIASFELWSGLWNPPSRYLTTLVPLLAMPLAFALRVGGRVYALLYTLLAIPGMLLACAMLADARRFWPTSPLFAWLAEGPDPPLHVDLRQLLPSFLPPEDLQRPTESAWIVALSCVAVFVGWLFTGGRPTRLAGIAWLCGVAIVGIGWYAMNADLLRPRTILVERQRWNLSGSGDEPRGIAYLDGAVYVTTLRGESVVAVDIGDGTQRRLATGPTGHERPADIELGPDGLLYVLSNGAGRSEVLAMRPNGQIVREVPLGSSTDVTMGLTISPDATARVADMIGGRVRVYESNGGAPSGVFGGLTGGFNNPSDVALDDDGTFYVAESSAHRVQHLDANGRFMGEFDLTCEPHYLSLSQKWLDLTCGAGLVSINTRTGDLQRTQIKETTAALQRPQGLAPGPDGTLFVVDGQTLIQFSIQH